MGLGWSWILTTPTFPDSDEKAEETAHVDQLQDGEQLDGKLESNPTEERLPRSIIEVNNALIEEGTLVEAACNQQLFSFVPDFCHPV